MKILPNWRDAWKWLSVQIAVVAGSLQAIVLAFPSVHDWLGDFTSHVVGLVMIVGLLAARMVDQSKTSGG